MPAARSDVESVNAITRALYESVSFLPGREPDWNRLRSLFFPGARLTPPKPPEGATEVLDVDGFIANSMRYIENTDLRTRGFHEVELARQIDQFGNMAHVLSTYSARYTAAEPRPVQRGINSIQLLREEGRWWVISVMWEVEREGNPLPELGT